MASAMDKQPAAARLAAVAAAAGCLPTATNGRQNSYTTARTFGSNYLIKGRFFS